MPASALPLRRESRSDRCLACRRTPCVGSVRGFRLLCVPSPCAPMLQALIVGLSCAMVAVHLTTLCLAWLRRRLLPDLAPAGHASPAARRIAVQLTLWLTPSCRILWVSSTPTPTGEAAGSECSGLGNATWCWEPGTAQMPHLRRTVLQVCSQGPAGERHWSPGKGLRCSSVVHCRRALTQCAPQVVLFCGEQLSAAQYADLALQHFNIRVQPHFQVGTPPSAGRERLPASPNCRGAGGQPGQHALVGARVLPDLHPAGAGVGVCAPRVPCLAHCQARGECLLIEVYGLSRRTGCRGAFPHEGCSGLQHSWLGFPSGHALLAGVCGHGWLDIHIPAGAAGGLQRGRVRALPYGALPRQPPSLSAGEAVPARGRRVVTQAPHRQRVVQALRQAASAGQQRHDRAGGQALGRLQQCSGRGGLPAAHGRQAGLLPGPHGGVRPGRPLHPGGAHISAQGPACTCLLDLSGGAPAAEPAEAAEPCLLPRYGRSQSPVHGTHQQAQRHVQAAHSVRQPMYELRPARGAGGHGQLQLDAGPHTQAVGQPCEPGVPAGRHSLPAGPAWPCAGHAAGAPTLLHTQALGQGRHRQPAGAPCRQQAPASAPPGKAASQLWHAVQALPLDRRRQPPCLISVAQFRPEKAHLLQLQALARAHTQAAASQAPGVGGRTVRHAWRAAALGAAACTGHQAPCASDACRGARACPQRLRSQARRRCWQPG